MKRGITASTLMVQMWIPRILSIVLIVNPSTSKKAALTKAGHMTAQRGFPRSAWLIPTDQGSWDNFAWTEPIPLGRIASGTHAIKLATDGQEYGVADLDRFELVGE